MRTDFSGSLRVGAMLRDIKRCHTSLEVKHSSDKAAGGIGTLPNKEKLEELYETWWDAAEINKTEVHNRLMNL